MDGDPDVKRARLDRDSGYPPPPPRAVAATTTTPSPHHPEPHPAAVAASYPPGLHLQAQPGPAAYRETLPDPRPFPQYQQQQQQQQPPPGAHPTPPDRRPSYGLVNAQQPPPYTPDKAGSRRPSVSSEAHRGPAPPPVAQDSHSGHMEHGAPPSGYLPPPSMDPYINGGAPNGLPYHPAQEVYQAGSVAAPPHSYPPTPGVSAYPQPTGYPQGPSTYGAARRKQVRAQQACNNCRQRKQKCDEARPCAYCKQEQLECEYKEVPPPKTDRTMTMLLDKQQQTTDRVEKFENAVHIVLSQILQQINRLSKQISGGQEDPSMPLDAVAAVMNVGIESAAHRDAPDIASMIPQNQYDDVAVVKPEEHHTGAHHLMNKWTDIKKFFELAEVRNEEYVHEEEEKRSILDPFDWCQAGSHGGYPPDFSHRSPSIGFTGDVPSSGSPSEGGSWSSRFPPQIKPDAASHGGLGPDGKLRLDDETVRRLYDSYFKHMWIMHPFIDARELKRMFERFIALYSSPSISPWSFPTVPDVQDAYVGLPLKRKRPTMAGDDHSTPSSPGGSLSGYSRRDGGRAIEHAIVLLVLALGKILEHDNFLLEDTCVMRARTSVSAGFPVSGQPTPSHVFIKPSPPAYYSTVPMSGVSSPGLERPSSGAESRGSPGEKYGATERRERRAQYKNLDVIPGLAYFAPASLILGNQHAGNEIQHAQAYLLAGLYMGQLGRVLDSWNYIYTASRTVVVLLRTRHYDDLKLKGEDKPPPMNDVLTTVSTLYWSTLQLESDIRAELDKLPPSLIWGYEDSLRMPERTLGAVGSIGNEYIEIQHGELSVRDVMFHYQAQISIRRTLNRAHAALYSVEDRAKKAPRGTFKVTWADADAPELWDQLTNWRRILPPNLQWQDSDDPAAEINTARLRGKYYGAAYMITRPYLCYAIHQMRNSYDEETLKKIVQKVKQNSPPAAPNTDQRLPPLYYSDRENAEHIIWACIQCIDAAMKSTKAFDGLSPSYDRISKRPRVTNIHGTAAAQFSNMLVLAATYKSWLRDLVDHHTFWELMKRTITLLGRLSPLSPVFQINKSVLEKITEELQLHDEQYPQPQYNTPITLAGRGVSHPLSANSSFSGYPS